MKIELKDPQYRLLKMQPFSFVKVLFILVGAFLVLLECWTQFLDLCGFVSLLSFNFLGLINCILLYLILCDGSHSYGRMLSQSCQSFKMFFFSPQSKPHIVEAVRDMDKVVNPFNQSTNSKLVFVISQPLHRLG